METISKQINQYGSYKKPEESISSGFLRAGGRKISFGLCNGFATVGVVYYFFIKADTQEAGQEIRIG